jgi:hypothetical protein
MVHQAPSRFEWNRFRLRAACEPCNGVRAILPAPFIVSLGVTEPVVLLATVRLHPAHCRLAPARRSDLGPSLGGEPVALTGQLGGTDEFLGRQELCSPDSVCSGQTEQTPDPANVFGTASCGYPGWNIAGAAGAKESTAIRETRELKENSSEFRRACIDNEGH